MYRVKLILVEDEHDGYIRRNPKEPRTRHNTWNGWEAPVWMNREQVEAFIKWQQQYKREGGCIDDWSIEGDTITIKAFEMEDEYDLTPTEIGGVKYWEVSFGYCWELASD